MRHLLAAPLLCLGLALVSVPGHARDDGQYVNSPDRDWYRNAELTPEAQKRFSFKKCCDHSDVVRTQFRVNKTTHGDEWFYMADGQWKLIPADIIHLDKSAPDNQPTLFVFGGQETCFFPGGSGI